MDRENFQNPHRFIFPPNYTSFGMEVIVIVDFVKN